MARRYGADSGEQLELAFGPIRNSDLFSNHWLESRLPLEPEWKELEPDARQTLDKMATLWTEEKGRVDKYDNEQSLEYAFIQRVLESLGWKIIYQTFVRGRKPDYALFPDDNSKNAALNAGKHSQEFWRFPSILADAKAWDVRLDRPITVENQREYPPEQIEWYLDKSHLDYAVLTNGRQWRLIPRELAPDQRRFQTYLEFDLPAFLGQWEKEKDLLQRQYLFPDFLRFYLLFSPAAFAPVQGRVALIQRAREGSSEFRLGIGEDLKSRVFEALRFCIEGFLKYEPNHLKPETDIARCREQSFILLYRLLFTMYAEDRGLLPYRRNRLYTENRSLARHRRDIAARLDRLGLHGTTDFSRESTALWDEALGLFDLINAGKETYEVPAYNGGLFDPAANEFLSSMKMSDWHMARVIDHLGRAEDETHSGSGLCQVDYRDLQIQHLGNIYEGLLELHPRIAEKRLLVVRASAKTRRSEEKTISEDQALPRGFEKTGIVYEAGSVYLETDKGERRASGSYYTPDHIVNYIVEKTLGPLCSQIDVSLRHEIEDAEKMLAATKSGKRIKWEETLARLRAEYDDRILNLRVLDPAMGSGHFLLRACQYLAEEIATHPYAGEPETTGAASEESAMTFWKRRVVERCLYGVDLNPLAVELAKLALWLETVSTDQPLTFLDHHLRDGNSLVGGDLSRLGALPHVDKAFEAAFGPQVKDNLPRLLKPLDEIRGMPSESAAQVKEKERLYRKVFERARKPFTQVADLWCSTYYLRENKRNPYQYQSAVNAMGKPTELKRLIAEPWFKAGLDRARQEDAVFFHWEFEFPEVFFSGSDERLDAGFDAIIGNPPYDVLSEKETGHDLGGLRSFIEDQAVYAPSRRGKNNLYKLFICRSLQLLAVNGRLGFIVPMPLLGDDQAADIRREIIKQGAFTSVDAFPQKDDPHRRVFPEAKLSTVVFTVIRATDKATKRQAFVSRVHPANVIEQDSPSLSLTTEEIPLYDASNLSIVCCSQEDWGIATRIMTSGRLTRLGEVCPQFQGEINETNDRAKGRISYEPQDGPEVIRGAHVCLYTIREASQGRAVFVLNQKFRTTQKEDSKAWHHKYNRVGFQRKSPQNNFRRLIAAFIEKGTFLLESVSYVPEHHCSQPLHMVLALLNSRLAEWYFRLGSTNAQVSEYQFDNLPFPVFAADPIAGGGKSLTNALGALDEGDIETTFQKVLPAVQEPPFGAEARDLIIECVKRIIAIEKERGEISRSERSALAPAAQPYQDLINRLFYTMAGLSDSEVAGLESRLRTML